MSKSKETKAQPTAFARAQEIAEQQARVLREFERQHGMPLAQWQEMVRIAEQVEQVNRLKTELQPMLQVIDQVRQQQQIEKQPVGSLGAELTEQVREAQRILDSIKPFDEASNLALLDSANLFRLAFALDYEAEERYRRELDAIAPAPVRWAFATYAAIRAGDEAETADLAEGATAEGLRALVAVAAGAAVSDLHANRTRGQSERAALKDAAVLQLWNELEAQGIKGKERVEHIESKIAIKGSDAIRQAKKRALKRNSEEL